MATDPNPTPRRGDSRNRAGRNPPRGDNGEVPQEVQDGRTYQLRHTGEVTETAAAVHQGAREDMAQVLKGLGVALTPGSAGSLPQVMFGLFSTARSYITFTTAGIKADRVRVYAGGQKDFIGGLAKSPETIFAEMYLMQKDPRAFSKVTISGKDKVFNYYAQLAAEEMGFKVRGRGHIPRHIDPAHERAIRAQFKRWHDALDGISLAPGLEATKTDGPERKPPGIAASATGTKAALKLTA